MPVSREKIPGELGGVQEALEYGVHVAGVPHVAKPNLAQGLPVPPRLITWPTLLGRVRVKVRGILPEGLRRHGRAEGNQKVKTGGSQQREGGRHR